MKKIFILAMLLTVYSNIFAFLTQRNWRWRNDDGDQTTATWKAAENTTAVLSSASEIFRLRIEVYNNTGGAVGVLDTLQYATATTGPWTNLDTLAGSNPFMISKTSAFVVQDEPTTSQLTDIALTFFPGKIMVDSMVLKNYSLPDQQTTEFEWALQGTSNLLPNTTYYFRHWGSTATSPLPVGTTYPSLTTAAVLPIQLAGFAVSRDDKRIKLQWVTSSEENNSRFEIQRSNDGRTWQTIASVKGKGTTAASNTYTMYDESPLAGINYYMIKQYDVNGQSHLSEVRFLRMSRNGKQMISVSPNPAHSEIKFSIADNDVSNVEAILTNINGKIIHREIIKKVAANTLNKLNLRLQPTPGVYFLKLKADGISESVRVVVE
jgi:hypothetical protein